MEKKLVAKTQKILPNIPQYANLFSNLITSTSEDSEMIKRKGTIYGVFEVSGTVEFETSVITKTISDILQDSYFQSDNISPVQSLERAILDTKDKITKQNENTLRARNTDLKLDIVVAVLWGNVLYVVQHGKGSAIIMREGESKPVSFLAEGNFASASGIVKNDDVVVLSTTSFAEKFPPETLLRAGNNTFDDLPPESSCLMIKFSIDTAFTADEQINFGLKKKNKKPILNFGKLKSIIGKKNKEKQPKKDSEGIMSITEPSPKEKKVKIRTYIILALLIGFIISVVLTIKGGKKYSPIPEEQEKEIEREAEVSQKETGRDESFFYDVLLADSNASPTDIVATENILVLADTTTGKIYTSDIETPQFSEAGSEYMGIKNMILKDNLINFSDKGGYKQYNIETQSAETFLSETGLEITFPYLEFVYEIDGDTIYKYSQTDGRSLWTQSENLPGAVSMTIDVSIYVLTKTGEVQKYTAGEEDTFELKNTDMGLSNPTKIIMSPDLNSLYIADTGNKSIVVLDIEGNFETRIYHKEKETWNDIKSISISPGGDKLFVLNGSSVYEVTL